MCKIILSFTTEHKKCQIQSSNQFRKDKVKNAKYPTTILRYKYGDLLAAITSIASPTSEGFFNYSISKKFLTISHLYTNSTKTFAGIPFARKPILIFP
jgi:hypothetical protein